MLGDGRCLVPAREEQRDFTVLTTSQMILGERLSVMGCWGAGLRVDHLCILCAICLYLNLVSGPWRGSGEESLDPFICSSSSAATMNKSPLCLPTLLVCLVGPLKTSGAEPGVGLPGSRLWLNNACNSPAFGPLSLSTSSHSTNCSGQPEWEDRVLPRVRLFKGLTCI